MSVFEYVNIRRMNLVLAVLSVIEETIQRRAVLRSADLVSLFKLFLATN